MDRSDSHCLVSLVVAVQLLRGNSAAMPGLMLRQFFIVSRETPYLAEYMREEFRDEPDVLVLVDRRRGGERRAISRSVEVERRGQGDRRQRPSVDQQLRDTFHVLVTIA